MSAENTPPPTSQPNIPIPKIVPPQIKQPEPKVMHLRILLHGEVDIDVPDNTDIDALAKLVAKDVMSKATDFKVTRILVAKGLGGPVKVFS
jgi:hypothetical protein